MFRKPRKNNDLINPKITKFDRELKIILGLILFRKNI